MTFCGRAGTMRQGDGDDAPGRTACKAGKLFPNDCSDPGSRFDQLGSRLPAYARCLPTTETLARVHRHHGAAAAPVMRQWLELWRGSVGDVDAFARETGKYPLGPESEADAVGVPGEEGPSFVRAASLHALEDARNHVLALASGLPFSFMVCWSNRSQYMVKAEGVRRLVRASSFDQARVFERNLRANPYWTLAAFRDAAGRDMALARDAKHLCGILVEMAASGRDKAFVKAATGKGGTWVVPLDGLDEVNVPNVLTRTMGKAWRRFEDGTVKHGMLVQEFTPFTHEHRFFVVGHRVVASTPSDRSLSILDRDEARIVHPGVAALERPASEPGYYDRGATRTVADRSLTARMAWAARGLARALGRGGMGLQCYVLDIGLTADGRVLPVEVNTLLGAGLYAADMGRILRALGAWMARRGDVVRDVGQPRDHARPMATCMVEVERHARTLAREYLARDTGPCPERSRQPTEILIDLNFNAHAIRIDSIVGNARRDYLYGGLRRKKPLEWLTGENPIASDLEISPRLRSRWAGLVSKAILAKVEVAALGILGASANQRRHSKGHRVPTLDRRIPVTRTLYLPPGASRPLGAVGWAEWQADGLQLGRRDPPVVGCVVKATVGADDVDWGSTLAGRCGMLVLRTGSLAVVTSVVGPNLGSDLVARGVTIPAEGRTDPMRGWLPGAESLADRYVRHHLDGGVEGSWHAFLSGDDPELPRILARGTLSPGSWVEAYAEIKGRYEHWLRDDAIPSLRRRIEALEALRPDPYGRVRLPSADTARFGHLHGGEDELVIAIEDIDVEATCIRAAWEGPTGTVALRPGASPLMRRPGEPRKASGDDSLADMLPGLRPVPAMSG